jgi:spermidine synthase
MSHKNKLSGYFSSFFQEVILDVYQSQINPDLEVAIINGRYQLNTGKVNYSFGPLHDAFRKYFSKDVPKLYDDSKVLILGFGAGSVAYILRNELGFNSHITGIEVDETVIEIARKHFYLDKLKNIETHVSDAYDYVESCSGKFDLIVIDIYIDDKVPVKFESRVFIERIYHCLKDSGKVVFNRLRPANCGDQSIKVLTGKFDSIFPKVKTVVIPINKASPNYFIVGER